MPILDPYYAVLAKDRYGCANRRSKATCDNANTIDRVNVETRVLSALKDRLLTPELVAVFVSSFQKELARLQKDAAGNKRCLAEQLSAAQSKLDGITKAVEQGAWSETFNQRLTELEIQKKALLAQIQAAPNANSVVQLHPNAAVLYAEKVAQLQEALDPA